MVLNNAPKCNSYKTFRPYITTDTSIYPIVDFFQQQFGVPIQTLLLSTPKEPIPQFLKCMIFHETENQWYAGTFDLCN